MKKTKNQVKTDNLKKCRYCDNKINDSMVDEHWRGNSYYKYVDIDSDAKQIEVKCFMDGMFLNVEIPIEYCPICGLKI